MKLLTKWRQEYYTLKTDRIPDGQGGFIDSGETKDVEFVATQSTNVSSETETASATVTASSFRFAVPLEVKLVHNQVFVRASDGQRFRVTSNPNDFIPPSYSRIKDYLITAEAIRENTT